MLNYEVDRELLNSYVPQGTELDSYNARTYVSLVGFRFLHTKLFGFLPVPFHADFDEVNLRLYVRRKVGNESRRGVVFIAEIVPKRAVAEIARVAYGENYTRLPMEHSILANGISNAIEYRFQLNNTWCKLHAQSPSAPAPAREGSLEQFITEHYWGYSAQRNGGTLEYHVSHVPWDVRVSTAAGFEGDASGIYGTALASVLRRRPDSAFIAEGSPITVFRGARVH